MGEQTILYSQHQDAGAKIVDFAGWEMPLYYQSQLREHQAVRQHAGLFDVSHMLAVDIYGAQALDYLSYILANNPQRLIPGKALYTCLLNHDGGIIDDLIVYQLSNDRYRIIINAGNRTTDWQWLQEHVRNFHAVTINKRNDLALLAVQGPLARDKVHAALGETQYAVLQNLKPFYCLELNNWCIARTGYTGEDGYEIMLPQDEAIILWEKLLKLDIVPCGLGARDTLRLEAGLNLHGADMDHTTTPLESNLAWTIGWEPNERDFIGRQALIKQRDCLQKELRGIVLEERAILRKNCLITTLQGEPGQITSASFSPSLGCSIGLVRLPKACGNSCNVTIRDKTYSAKLIKPPFMRKGKKAFL